MAVRIWVRLAFAAAASVILVASSAGQTDSGTANGSVTDVAYTAPPPPPNGAERMRLRDGIAASRGGDWISLMQFRDSASDPLVRRMLQWRLAASTEAPLYFSDIAQALTELQGWPGRTTMRTRAEQAIFDSTLNASERVAFLRQENGPTTGDGRIALALALRDLGQRSEAETIARAAWREDSLSANAEAAALATFNGVFSSEDHAARVDALLWRGQRSAAQQLMGRIASADRLVASARIALQTRARRGLQAAVDAVPATRQDDPGFMYDRAVYRRRTGSPETALPVMAEIDARQAPLMARDDIFRERRLYLPRALRAGKYRQA